MTNKKTALGNLNNGFFQDLILRIKLILRLMGDGRVNFFLKLIPVAALIYLFSPVDLIPAALLPVIGSLDDVAVLWLGVTLFVNLCPETVVKEHMQAMKKSNPAGTWQAGHVENESEDVIDAEAQDVFEEDK